MPAKKVKLVEVVWQDAQDLPGGGSWVDIKAIKAGIDSLTELEHSTGYMLGTYKGYLVLPSTKTIAENGSPLYSGVQLIPKGWIKEIKVIK